MQHSIHKAKRVPIRWGVIIKIVLSVSAVALIAGLAWYVASFVIPQFENTRLVQALDEITLRSLQNRMVRIETVLHLH